MAETYYDLGSYSRPVTTKSGQAQVWFDRGLVWSYGFNHEESVRCFEKALAADPDCAMAYWGVAYSLGPNYNKPWEFFDDRDMETAVDKAHRATAQAAEKATNASPAERAIIHAVQSRYPRRHEPGQPREECSIWNKDYAEAMGAVYKQHPDDLDVATLYADALMNLNPWQLWDLHTGKPAEGARTLEIKEVLERALKRDPKHPGLLHLYIHLMEMSSRPELALNAADHLRGLVPDAGHLNHMPTHLDILVGDYRRAVASNSRAILADEKYLRREGPMNFYSLYRSHDYHFRIYAAMFAGQSRVALDTVAQLEASIPEELLRVESPRWQIGWRVLPMRAHVLIRFGRWDDIISLQLPKDQTLYCVTTAMMHYAKGVAFAATGRVSEAGKEQEFFRDVVKTVPTSRTLFNNTCVDILGIAGAMLDGELEYRRGNVDLAFEHLREAIQLDDSLPYDEPWGWMQPTRHVAGRCCSSRTESKKLLRFTAPIWVSTTHSLGPSAPKQCVVSPRIPGVSTETGT